MEILKCLLLEHDLANLTSTDALYLAGRAIIAALCVAAAAVSLMRLAALRRAARREADGTPVRAVLPVTAAVLLLLASVLSIYDAWENIVVHPDAPILPSNWAWIPFDLLVPVIGMLLLRALAERDVALECLARQAVTDPLTGFRNRRGFMTDADAALARCARAGQETTVVMIDLDRFKAINDMHGHAAGDNVLRDTAIAIQERLRAGDLPGRLGGEEFALLLPDTGIDAAVAIAERLRVALHAAVPHPGGGRVTASFGVASVPARPGGTPRVRLQGLDAALAAADAALYRAKENGRDRVERASFDMTSMEKA